MVNSYINLKYKPKKTDLLCLYRVEPNRFISIKKAANHIAGESSIGTWTEVPNTRIKKLGAKVFEIKGRYIKIAYPIDLFEKGNMPQILSSIAGNIFGMKALKNLRLEDIKWPKPIIKSFKGPKFGIKGIRNTLKIKTRPLVGTIVKPKVGLTSKEHAKVAYQSWLGGLDLVKFDENLTSLKFNKFKNNITQTLKLKNKAEQETGEKKLYVANVTAETNEMIKRAKLVKKLGGKCVMVDIITTGWSALQTLRDQDLNLILHGHRAGHAAITKGKNGISMLVIADIARLLGIDQLHIGAIVGKMTGPKKEVKHIAEEIEHNLVKENTHTLAENWHNIKPTFAICSGGVHAGLIPKLVEILGKDIIIQAGGGCHGLGTITGAKAMRQAVDATMNKIPLKQYAETHKELKLSINKWGYLK